jgi:hypothetical protein
MARPSAAGWGMSPDPLLKDSLDLWSSRALAAGQQLGVFAELGKGPRTAARLAGALGLTPDAARDLLDALLALGWLQREGDDEHAVYVSTREGAHFLDPRSPAYLGDLLLAARSPWSGPHDTALDDALRAPAAESAPVRRAAWDTARLLMRQRLGALYGSLLAQQGHPGPVLDLQGEGARLACAWAAHAGREVTVTTLQPAAQVPAALAHVQACGLASRVRVRQDERAGDGDENSLPALVPHGTAVLSLLLEPAGVQTRRARMARGARALAPGGWLLVLDHLADDARRLHAPALVFGLAGRMTGSARGALTEGELRADCRACGLQDADCQPLPGGASALRVRRPT